MKVCGVVVVGKPNIETTRRLCVDLKEILFKLPLVFFVLFETSQTKV